MSNSSQDTYMAHKIVILGAGIGGVAAKIYNKNAIIVDKNDKVTVFPRMIQLLSGYPPDHILYERHVDIHDTVKSINFKEKLIIMDKKNLSYDDLIVALGKSQNYSFIPGYKYIYGFNDMQSAMKLKMAVDRSKYICIIGGGYLGVELAGTIKGKNITIVEAGNRLLSGLPERYHKISLDILQKLGVRVLFNEKVKEVTENSVITYNGRIKSDVAIFTGGFTGNSLISELDIKNKNSKVIVDEYLKSKDYDDVYACGDSMAIENSIMPMSAIIARSSGITAMKNALGENRKFIPDNFANIMEIGDYYFGDFFNVPVSGVIARLIKKAAIAQSLNFARSI